MPPIPLTTSNTPAAVVDDIRSTLADVTVGGNKLFKEARVIDDLSSFKRAGDALDGIVVGIAGGTPARGEPTDNADQYSERLAVSIAVRFSLKRAPGEDERAAVTEMNRIADLVRQALLLDRSRGNKCSLITWGGKPLRGTELDGEPKLDARQSNQAFWTFTLPVACGWGVSQ